MTIAGRSGVPIPLGQVARVVDGRIGLSLTFDHRAVDGALGAEFLAAFKALIEAPMTMLV